MNTVTTAAQVRTAVGEARRQGRQIAFVPTMGALHAGHLSLIAAAKASGGFIVVSIYVNPTQFGPTEDFQKYPRAMEADTTACRAAGVDLVFAPGNEEMYPPGDETRVRPGPLADALCGPFRPGHFEGVCTVVAKLFDIVQPDAAYFGEKDYQQVLIVERMVQDLRMPVRIERCPTIREPDGLAMSSRNVRLGQEERPQAVSLYQALCLARDRLRSGECSAGRIVAAMRAFISQHATIRVDYLSLVDPTSLAPVALPADSVLVAGAIHVGQTRLIDNMMVDVK